MSRDGVPLCPHHADATTPPMGWTMNDLRSGGRAPSANDRDGPRTGEIVANRANSASRADRSNRSSSRGARSDGADGDRRSGARSDRAAAQDPGEVGDDDGEPARAQDRPLTFRASRDLRSMSTSAASVDPPGEVSNGVIAADEEPSHNGSHDQSGGGASRQAARRPSSARPAPATRPSRRRDEVEEDELDEEDRFPWHFQFQNDEPEELQAKSRLLSRAFRSSVG